MGSNTNSPTPDPEEAKGAFRKPVNDAANRKYRRRSSASPSASPDESLKQEEAQHDGDNRRKHSSRDDRVYSRDRSSDNSRGGKYVDEEDRNYCKVSSRSGRESKGGAYTDHKDRGGDYNRSRENYHYKDKYNRDRSAERDSRDRYDDRERRGRDRDYRGEKRDGGRSSMDYRSEESRRNQDDSKAENRSKHLNDGNKKYNEGDSKGSRERFQDDAPVKRNEDTAVKRTKFSSTSDRNDPTAGSNQGQDVHAKDTLGQAVVNMPESAGNLDAAKVAAIKAAEMVNKNLVGTGIMTADQKKKLLWGNKKKSSAEESSSRWDAPIFSDRERQEKFNKLMNLRLRWYIWPIVGCERGGEVGTVPERGSGPNREAKRTSAGFRKAIHSWTQTKRWPHSRVGSLGVYALLRLINVATSCKEITCSSLSTLCPFSLYLLTLFLETTYTTVFGPFFSSQFHHIQHPIFGIG